MARTLHIPALFLFTLLCSAPALAQAPKPGDVLPPFSMEALALDEDAAALGLASNAPFTLKDIDAQYVLIEIIGVYCPICHEQAPALTKLYKQLKRAKLDSKIKMLGIAAGGTPMEVRHIRGKDYIYPVAHDTEYEIYASFSEPKTPFTMIVDKEGKVLYTHLGIIPDINAFFQEIKELVK